MTFFVSKDLSVSSEPVQEFILGLFNTVTQGLNLQRHTDTSKHCQESLNQVQNQVAYPRTPGESPPIQISELVYSIVKQNLAYPQSLKLVICPLLIL